MKRLRLFVALSLGMLGWAWAHPGVVVGAGPDTISFDRDIRPILSDSCFACHGPDSANRQAGLRLDRREEAIAPLESGATAIIPGDPATGALVDRITSTDPDLVMPPPGAKLGRLTAEQVDLLRRWIAAGAVYEPHWAFVAPVAGPLPPASDSTGDHPLDRLVAARLATRGLALQPEADPITLIRRASFDITGLPPTPEEVAAFVADREPGAWERLLERLLASPRYGERMAADWMDVARYADSYGFQVDRDRPMWPWRDWVIAAFNRNLPWNDFVTWQVAGDLLPGATDEQILATAFNRLHQQEAEGGSVEEEYRVNYVNDRVTTFGTAFLGLTLECARCHDHKFDPVSQREYYQLFAFFDDIDEAGLYSFFTPAVPTPKLALADDAARDRRARAEADCDLASAALARAEAAAALAAEWAAGRAPLPPAVHRGEVPGELVRYSFDSRAADGKFPSRLSIRDAATSPGENRLVAGHDGQAVLLTGDHPVQTPVGNFRRSEPFTIAAWIRVPEAYPRAVVWHRSQAWTDAGSRGYELLVEEGRLQWSLIHFWPGDAVSVRTVEPVPLDAWVHVAVSSDGSGRAAGLRVFVDGRPTALETVRDGLSREITGGGGDHVRIGERMRDHGFKGGLVDDFRVFSRRLSPLEIEELVRPGTITGMVAHPPADHAAAARVAALVGDYLAAAIDEPAAVARETLQAARRARDDIAEGPPEIMVMREMAVPKTAYVLQRGDYDKRREPVQPDTPAALPPFPPDAPRNRLGLARWLTAPDHPLLARVTVNRVWQGLFGLGLVKSPEDLGSQSVRPEHREALDWLARDFAGGGWDMKRLLKTIMTSRTYRQRSSADARVEADDPANVWLARGPRHRLPGEMIRDGILAAAGLLVEKVGGPGVNPYDLPESFKPAAAGSGDSLYRRSLYTFWRRTGPAPVLESFDVPKRVVCVARRDITNTPLHALVLLNGPQFVEAARVLAERLSAAGQPGDAALATAFERGTSRSPDATEATILRGMLAAQREWYAAHPDEAAKLVAVGSMKPAADLPAVDVAALAAVINALMSHDGCVVKR